VRWSGDCQPLVGTGRRDYSDDSDSGLLGRLVGSPSVTSSVQNRGQSLTTVGEVLGRHWEMHSAPKVELGHH
jgi:hypothetical protein